MMLNSAHKFSLILGSIFLIVIGVALLGAFYYKQTSAENSINYIPEISETTTPPLEAATLQFIPMNEKNTQYRIVVSNIIKPITGVAFQLKNVSSTARITANTVETNDELSDSGWETAVNSSEDSGLGQELSFSMVLSSPGATVAVPSLEIGTITFASTPQSTDLLLNQEESMVIYSEDETASLNLVLETATIGN